MRAEGDMCSVVFPKRIAVEEMVVKPVHFLIIIKDKKVFIRLKHFTDHQKEETMQRDT